MTLQPLWDRVDTASPDLAPMGLLLAIFGILAAVCGAILGIRWVVRKAAGARQDARRWQKHHEERLRW